MEQRVSMVTASAMVRAMRRPAGAVLAVLFVVLLPLTGHAAGGDILWEAANSLAGKQEPAASAVDLSGNILVTGSTTNASDDYYTVKFTADGSGIAWTATYDRAGGIDRATAVAVDSNSDVIVTGYAWNGLNFDIHTIKYSGGTGAVVWQHTFNAGANGNDYAVGIAIDSLNNIYVAGYAQNAAGNDDFLLLKYGPDGAVPVWQASYNGAANGQDRITAVIAGANSIAVTGYSNNVSGVAGDFDMLTQTYDFNGSMVWEARYSSAGTWDDRGGGLRFDASGNVIAVGSVANGANLDTYTVKYNGSTGAVLWQKLYDGGFDDEPRGVWVDGAGDVFMTGYTWTLAGRYEFYTARYRGSDGLLIWEKIFGSGGSNDDVTIPTGIIVDGAGDVFVTGHTFKTATGETDFQTIKYRRDNGTQLWQAMYNGAAGRNDEPVGIGLSPAGELIVAGWSDRWTAGASDYDYYVIMYDPGLLNAPTGLTAEAASGTSINLAWDDNAANEDGYRIERKTGAYGTYAEIAVAGIDAASYTDTWLSPNTKYYYRVRAYNAGQGASHYSNEAHALTTIVAYAAPVWSSAYNGPGNSDDFATALGVGSDNSPVVTGFSMNNELLPSFDYFTMKLNRANGASLWSQRYNDPDDELDVATCLSVDTAGSVVVSGYSSLYGGGAGNTNDIYTVKYPSTGTPESWHDQYNGPAGDDDRSEAVRTAADGSNNIFVAGYGKNASGNDDIYVIKYLPDGTRAWAVSYNGGGNDYPSSVAIDELTGHVYVSGAVFNGANYDFYTAKFNGSTGSLVWSDLFNGAGNSDDRAESVAVDPYGNVYSAGYAVNGSGNRDWQVIKYDGSNGSRLWQKTFDGPAVGGDEAKSVRVDPVDHEIVVAGTILTAAGNHDFHVIRYDADGAVVWERTLERSSDDYAQAMEMDASGHIYVAGDANSGANLDMLAVAYDFEGTVVGAMLYNGAAGSTDSAAAVAPNTLGEAFVAGYSENAAGNADYAVLKYLVNSVLVPAPFTAGAGADTSKVLLGWAGNTPGTTFRIERTVGLWTPSSVWTLLTQTPLSAGTVTYQDSGLNAGSVYCYRIEAFLGSVNSRKTVSCAFTGPFLGPLTVVSASGIDLSWPNVSGNSGYRIERKEGAAGAWITVATVPKDTATYPDTGLTGGTVYSYRVSALYPMVYSIPGNTQTATTMPSPPVLNPLSGITASKVDLSWSNVAGETGYRIERKTGAGGSWAQIGTTAANIVSYSDTTASANTLYYYRVRAFNASGDSAASTELGATTLMPSPLLLTATPVSQSQINLTWQDVSGETGYIVQESNCSYYDSNPGYCSLYTWAWSGWYQVGTAGVDATTFFRTGLQSGWAYKYSVIATGTSANNSAAGNEISAWTYLAAPALTLSPASETSLKLDWNNISGETGFAIERKQGAAGSWSEITTPPNHLSLNTVTYTNTGLLLQTEYCYRVRAFSTVPSAPSPVYSNEPCMYTPLQAPVLNTLTVVSTTQIDLSWNNVAGNTGYEVQRAATNDPQNPQNVSNWAAWSTIATLAADTASYQSTGLTPGYTYKYRVRDSYSGGYSAYSNEQYATTIPSAPTMSVPTAVSTTQINPSWTNVNGETSFKLDWKEGAAGSWSSPISVGQNLTSYSHTGLTQGSVYYYRIRASNAYGDSAYSNEVSQTTLLPAPTLNTPAGVTVSKIDLSWTAVSGNTGYRVERSLDGTSWSTIVANVGQNVVSYSNTGLSAGTLYFYRVRALNTAGASDPSNVQSATTTPSTPAIGLSVLSSSSISLSWPLVKGATEYRIDRKTGTGGSWGQIGTVAAAYQESYCGHPYPAVGCTVLSPGSAGFVSSGLTKNTEYCYQVKAWNATGGESVPSVQQCATTSSLATPGLTATAVTSQKIRLDWVYNGSTCLPDPCDAPDGFEIEVRLWNGSWLLIATKGAGAATMTDTKTEPAKEYRYRIRAFKGSDRSAYGEAYATTPVWQAGDEICP